MTIQVKFIKQIGEKKYYKNKNNRICCEENGTWFAVNKNMEIMWEFGNDINVVTTNKNEQN